MKKIAMMMAVLGAISLVSCDKTPVEEPVKSVKLSEHEVVLQGGGSVLLKATTDPEGKEVTWTSTDREVATVNASGNVAAVADGEAWIIAKAGEAADSCRIIVSSESVYNWFEIADYGMFGNWEEIPGVQDTIIETTDGTQYSARLKNIQMYAWDSDVTFIDGKGWAGNGFFYELGSISLYVITKGTYAGYYIGSANGYHFADLQGEHGHGWGQCGVIDLPTYGKFVQAQYSAEETPDFDEMSANTYGALICMTEESEDSETGFVPSSYYGLYYGAIKELVLLPGERDEDGSKLEEDVFAAKLEWGCITEENRLYGFEVDMNVWESQQKVTLLTPYEQHYKKIARTIDPWGIFEAMEEGSKAQKMAPKSKYVLGDQSKLHTNMPALPRHNQGKLNTRNFIVK